MERNETKIVYEDNGITKVIRGFILEQDEFTITISAIITNEKIIIGKRAIIKIKNDIALTNSPAYGFDIWYKKAPIVVGYNPNKKNITIGAVSLSEAEKAFGKDGLKNVYSLLEPGWDGRETVGGSPRNEELTFPTAEEVFEKMVKMKKSKQVALDWIGQYLEC